MILDDLREQIQKAVLPWARRQGLETLPAFALDEPPADIGADAACNLALVLAKPLKKSPRAVAQDLQAVLAGSGDLLQEVSIAGPGFLNIRWPIGRLQAEITRLLSDPSAYARQPEFAKEKVLIEFVSANPTGPLHVGHGRGAALGDSLARILAHLGSPVTREFYINDAGNQIALLGASVVARVHELEGKPFTLPEEGYHGDYVRDVAKKLIEQQPAAKDQPEAATAFALKQLLAAIEKDLADFGVRFDVWSSEAALMKKGAVEKRIEALRARGFIQEEDGALWFVAPDTPEGDRDKNRVLKRRDGRWTYFASDIAYHAEKFERGFQRLVDLWGADHHGYVARVKGSMQALGYDPERLHVVLYQLVSLTRGGVPVSMSKRSGDFITLREVLDEVGKDACRFFFALRGPNTALDFDLELAKKQSADNPVYYLQYAHARICSIFRQAAAGGFAPSADLSPLQAKEERELMRRLALFPQALLVCANEDSPHPLANYLLSLGRQFHHFYDHHRVLGEAPAVTGARLALLQAVRERLKLGLELLGVSAPESM